MTDRYVSFDGSIVALHQHFTYSTIWNSQAQDTWSSKQTIVTTTDVAGNTSFTTTYTYTPVNGPSVPDLPFQVDNQLPVESSIVTTDSTGKVLRTVNKTWSDQYLLTNEQTMFDNGLTANTGYKHGPGAVVTEKDEYDFGQGVPVARQTKTAYTPFSSTQYGAILDKPSTIQVYDRGVLVNETDYSYDMSPVSPVSPAPLAHDEMFYSGSSLRARGNNTKTTRKCFLSGGSACPDSVSRTTYDETGQPTQIQDASGNVTQYSYADNYTSDNGSPSGIPTHI